MHVTKSKMEYAKVGYLRVASTFKSRNASWPQKRDGLFGACTSKEYYGYIIAYRKFW